MTDTVTKDSFDDPIAELNITKDAIRRILEVLDYVHQKLDDATTITTKYPFDAQTQSDMLDCTVHHLFNYIENNLQDI